MQHFHDLVLQAPARSKWHLFLLRFPTRRSHPPHDTTSIALHVIPRRRDLYLPRDNSDQHRPPWLRALIRTPRKERRPKLSIVVIHQLQVLVHSFTLIRMANEIGHSKFRKRTEFACPNREMRRPSATRFARQDVPTGMDPVIDSKKTGTLFERDTARLGLNVVFRDDEAFLQDLLEIFGFGIEHSLPFYLRKNRLSWIGAVNEQDIANEIFGGVFCRDLVRLAIARLAAKDGTHNDGAEHVFCNAFVVLQCLCCVDLRQMYRADENERCVIKQRTQ
ncbi:hypothetical protein CaCOL14_010759 [Colletotrichum acutatum]